MNINYRSNPEGHHTIQCVCTESIILSGQPMAKAKKPIPVGEELVLPAAEHICQELRDAEVQSVSPVPLLASTITR